jgi:hypothetical protein
MPLAAVTSMLPIFALPVAPAEATAVPIIHPVPVPWIIITIVPAKRGIVVRTPSVVIAGIAISHAHAAIAIIIISAARKCRSCAQRDRCKNPLLHLQFLSIEKNAYPR